LPLRHDQTGDLSCLRDQRLNQRRLADPRLAADEDRLPLPGDRAPKRGLEYAQWLCAPDQETWLGRDLGQFPR